MKAVVFDIMVRQYRVMTDIRLEYDVVYPPGVLNYSYSEFMMVQKINVSIMQEPFKKRY